jgi:hypothetical protein
VWELRNKYCALCLVCSVGKHATLTIDLYVQLVLENVVTKLVTSDSVKMDVRSDNNGC